LLRHLGLLALAALPALGCAKGEEIAPGEVVIFALEPDAGADAGSTAAAGGVGAASGTGGAGGMPTTSPPPMVAGQPPAGNTGGASSVSDAGTNDAGRSEDRPVDAGN